MAGGPAHVGRAYQASVPSTSPRKHENHEPPRARKEGRGLRWGRGCAVTSPPRPPGGFPPPARGVPAESALGGGGVRSSLGGRPRVPGEPRREPCVGSGRRVQAGGPPSTERGALITAGWSRGRSCVGLGRCWVLPKLLPCLLVLVLKAWALEGSGGWGVKEEGKSRLTNISATRVFIVCT